MFVDAVIECLYVSVFVFSNRFECVILVLRLSASTELSLSRYTQIATLLAWQQCRKRICRDRCYVENCKFTFQPIVSYGFG